MWWHYKFMMTPQKLWWDCKFMMTLHKTVMTLCKCIMTPHKLWWQYTNLCWHHRSLWCHYTNLWWIHINIRWVHMNLRLHNQVIESKPLNHVWAYRQSKFLFPQVPWCFCFLFYVWEDDSDIPKTIIFISFVLGMKPAEIKTSAQLLRSSEKYQLFGKQFSPFSSWLGTIISQDTGVSSNSLVESSAVKSSQTVSSSGVVTILRWRNGIWIVSLQLLIKLRLMTKCTVICNKRANFNSLQLPLNIPSQGVDQHTQHIT